MSDAVKPEANKPAEYALGLIRGEERRELDARLATDEGFRSQVERWQNILAPLEDGDDAEIPPAGLFEKILNRIDEVGLQLPGTFTQRGAAADWIVHSPGITYRVLNIDDKLKRQSLLVKMQPGAIYNSHHHDVDEECLVIEGDLQFGDLRLHAGDFHLATPAMVHPIGRTKSGCLLHVVLGLNI
jgi:quercetin dioxygenase-like cupin family protein